MDFIDAAKRIHGDRYLYNNTNYLNSKTKVEIICTEHGSFFQIPSSHLRGNGCRKCYNKKQSHKTKSPEIFLQECNKIHGDKYDYSKTKYQDVFTKITIICLKHGEFSQNPTKHLTGQGCPKCSGRKKTNEDFISSCIERHGDKYDYSRVKFFNNKTEIEVICKEHGIFKQKAGKHINGSGCHKCSGGMQSNTEDFIEKSKKIHGDLYDYTFTIYLKAKSKLSIICKTHGEFSQLATKHLAGAGCPRCSSSRGESSIRLYLERNSICFIDQYSFKNFEKYRFDFYLLDFNTCIEFDGIQHFEPVEFFGGKKRFERQKVIDSTKNEICNKNNIKLLRIPYFEKEIENVLKNLISETKIIC